MFNLPSLPQFTIPPVAYVIVALLLITGGSLYYGHVKSNELTTFKQKVATDAQVQAEADRIKDIQAKQQTKDIIDNYEQRIKNIRDYYAIVPHSLRNPSSNTTGTIPPATTTTDGTPSDPQFVAKCAITTQQLESLQEWVREQVGIYNVKD